MSETAKKPFLLWSCILHVTILLFLILSVSLSGSSASSSSSSQQNIIQATVIDSQALTQYQNAITQKQVAKQQAIQKVQEVIKADQDAQKAAEKAAQIAQAKATAEAKAAADAAKAAAIKQSIEKQLKASMQKQLASDNPNTKPSTKPNTKPSTISGVQSNPGLTDKYKAMIIQSISEQWVVPQNLPKNISCVLNVRVAPGGVVIQVTIEKSSGNPILDNSAMAAVNKASPLPVPTDPNLFDAFRTLKLTVKPDGSMID